MDTTLAVVLVLIGLLALAVGYARSRRPRRHPRRRDGPEIRAHERALAAQFEIEEHDIEEMIEAQIRLRQRTGKRTLGDELADEALRREREE